MNFSLVFCHYKQGDLSAYTVEQLLKFKGKHNIEILVCDNSKDESIRKLDKFGDQISIYRLPDNVLQSHGIGYNLLFEKAKNEWIITLESDSFPTIDNWLDYYEELIGYGIDSAGSLLQLSGGQFIHPAGAIYRKSIWKEACEYYNNIEYEYFPNMGMKEGFACHLMIRKDIVNKVLINPSEYIELADGYKGLSIEEIHAKRDYYSSTIAPMHNSMGNAQESVNTYGFRHTDSEAQEVILKNIEPIIYRIGNEPAQTFCYWQVAKGKRVSIIPTEIRWMPNRVNQQQEYTINAAGIKHLWAGSSYLDMKNTDLHDVYIFKQNQINELINGATSN